MIRIPLILLACVAVLIPGCGDSKDPPPPLAPPGSSFEDLTVKEHVLSNLVLSYLERDIDEYKRLLDGSGFTFFLSMGDVSNGAPAQWDRVQDELATAGILDESSTSPQRIVAIDLNVGMSALQWDPVTPDTLLYPGETWYTTTTNYSFTFRTASDISYITSGSPRTEFTVRDVGTDTAPQWRLVRWRDMGDDRGIFSPSATAGIEARTWGAVKNIYRRMGDSTGPAR